MQAGTAGTAGLGWSLPRDQMLVAPSLAVSHGTWWAVEVRQCRGAARVLRESPAGVPPSIRAASPPGPSPKTAGGALTRPPY